MTFDLWLTAIAIICLLMLSAFFSGSEAAFTATSRARIHELERRGNWRAALVLRLTAMRERLVGALLLGNNAVNILATALAAALLVHLCGDWGALIAAALMTFLVLIFGEVLPRIIAVLHPERVALTAAPAVRLTVAIFGQMVMAVEYAVKRLLALFGIDTSKADNVLSAHEELRGAIDLHHKEGAVVKKDRDMLGGILDLKSLEIFDVMVHRTKMVMLDSAKPQNEIIAEVLKSGHSRIPIWQGTADNITGILHAKDLLKALQENGGDASRIAIDAIVKPPWFVPDTRTVADQLNAFLKRKQHSAIVVDEYGEVMGLITLEDILEEIVGEIADEHDAVTAGVRQQPDGSYVIDGAVPIRDLNRALDWELPDDEATTLAGLVIHEARMIPNSGQTFTFHGTRFEVLRKRRHQVTAIKATPLRRER